ncbi:MAG: hypothetical protein A2068_04610 [Ignavibacteria bacterium GWB2_35_6b]|nr:MAG: hypothetical protein A2068_04610 [Ignavibacteria bacterium GWB2_35_6b]
MKEHFLKLFEYNNWANNKILEIILKENDFPQIALKYFSHLLIAEKTWMVRIKSKEVPSNDFWPEISKNEFRELINKNINEYLELINNSNDKLFDEKIKYKTSKGIEFDSTLKDILTHISMHSMYHRGQVNTALRNSGLEPVNIDFITYTRI